MYNGTKVFDVHGHVSAPAAARSWIFGQLASNTAGRSPISGGASAQGELSDEAFKASGQRHADYMGERNIDVQIIGPRPFTMLGWMEDHLFPGWCTFTNDTIQKQTSMFPDRFLGASMLPQQSTAPDLKHVIPELDRCVKEYGFVGSYLSPDPAGHRETPGVNEAYWYPLYERCQELNIPLIVHGTNCMDRRHRPLPQNYQMGFVLETYLATQLFSHTDVFEKFPNLKIVMCHGGGALNRFIPTDRHLSQKDFTKNLFYDTCTYDVNYMECSIKQRGVSQLCFGTEAPGSGGAVRPETGKTSDDMIPIISAIDFLSEDDKLTIFNKNPLKVFPQFK
ncbi:MAG: amidohydrolase family protein [Dehalococcoidia bacterium]|nr:amidohydrolase family protein [Dehalococcoidia bacterium]